jgi:hypothetical protein
VNRRSTIRASINAGLAADASLSIRDNCPVSGKTHPGASGADIHTRRLFAVLTDDGDEDGNLLPLLHPYPRKGWAARALVGETAGQLAGLASCAAFGNDGDGSHLDGLLIQFFAVNAILINITHFSRLSSRFM